MLQPQQQHPCLNRSPPLSWRLTSVWGCSFQDNSDGTEGQKGAPGKAQQWNQLWLSVGWQACGGHISTPKLKLVCTRQAGRVDSKAYGSLGEVIASTWGGGWLVMTTRSWRIIVRSWLRSTVAKLEKAREGWPIGEWCPGWQGGEGRWGPGVVVGLICSVWRAGSCPQLHCWSLPVGRQWLMELHELESQD